MTEDVKVETIKQVKKVKDLFDCSFPGRKSNRFYKGLIQYILSLNPDWVCEPFAGTGQLSQAALREGVLSIVGENDFYTKAVWICYANKSHHDNVYEALHDYKEQFSGDMPHEVWKQFISSMPSIDSINFASYNFVDRCAKKLVYQKLSIGGINRRNKNGDLNVKLDNTKLKRFLSWNFKFPDINGELMVFHNYRMAIHELEFISGSGVIWIDPPYELPKKQEMVLTPTYSGYDPNTSSLCIDAVEIALNARGVRKIFISNYYCDELNKRIELLAPKQSVKLHLLQSLQNLNFFQANRKTKSRSQPLIEALWEITLDTNFSSSDTTFLSS
jgi:hypothetical protein